VMRIGHGISSGREGAGFGATLAASAKDASAWNGVTHQFVQEIGSETKQAVQRTACFTNPR
jgi:6-phosphogluconate dehydrogenase